MNRVENFSRGIIYDRISNCISNLIIVPNDNTRIYLEQDEKVRPQKIVKIEFGFNLSDLLAPTQERVQRIQEEYSLSSDKYVIGIVSRFSPVKGLKYSLPAVANFLDRNQEAILLLAGVGNDPPIELKEAISGISPEQVRLIPRVNDMAAFYHCLDVFIHTPIDETVESFGLVYVEAFAAGVPSIITLSGIAKDIASDGENCLVVDYCDVQGIETALETLSNDKGLSRKLSLNARARVSSFTLQKMCESYRDLIERV
jgi:glycosyltransferase involved in cell wall biosynthesis